MECIVMNDVFIEGFSNSMDERLIKPHRDDLQVMEIGRYYALHRMGAMSLREASEALANLEEGKRVKVSHETLRRYFRILDREIHGVDLDGVHH